MDTGAETIMTAAIVGGVIGAIPGILALVARWRDRQASYLLVHLKIDVNPDNFVTALTMVENRTNKKNKLINALLLIGPESEDPRETARALGFEITSTNEIAEINLDKEINGQDGRCLVPLPFFYSENVAIADEVISYRVPINTSRLCKGTFYSVRFFLLPKKPRLHRTTHDCFVLPSD